MMKSCPKCGVWRDPQFFHTCWYSSSNGTTWTCAACQVAFYNYDRYLDHPCLETQAAIAPYGCPTCLQNFLTEAGRANHTCDAIRAFSFKREDISMAFETKDSGERQEFSTGMRRDVQKGKPRYDLIWQPGLKRLAELMGRGAEKYSERNWEKASTQEELDRFKASAFRHFMQWFSGEVDEDHMSGTIFNLFGAEYVKDKLNANK